jgi:hypothetical protein
VAGAPAFSGTTGRKSKGKPKDFPIQEMKEFNEKAHYSRQDELMPK